MVVMIENSDEALECAEIVDVVSDLESLEDHFLIF